MIVGDSKIEIEFFDQVVIRIKDMEFSAKWCERVSGLKHYQFPELGNIPILLLLGKSGIALFPANSA